MSYINVAFDLANAETAVIPLDRWAEPKYTVQLESGTSILIEGTLQRVNRGETAVWDTAEGVISGATPAELTTLAALTPVQSPAKVGGPHEALRITATGACVGRVMQTGASSG